MSFAWLKRLLPTAMLAWVSGVSGQTLISDFADIAGDGAVFLDTWYEVPTNQYTQNVGNITVEPKGGGAGNPRAYGRFVAALSLDLSSHASLEVIAREGAGNGTASFSVVFYSGVDYEIGASRVYTFSASAFSGGSFVTRSVSLDSPDFSDAGFDPSAVTYWSIEGDYTQDPDTGPDFRFDFDNLQLTPIPEPSTWALFGLGSGLLWWMRRHKSGRS